MAKRLKDKVVLIVGGTSGIGAATAIECANEGAKVAIAGRRADKGSEVVTQIQKCGAEALFVHADVAIEEDVKNMIQTVVNHFGRLDGCFNNAGLGVWASSIDNMKIDEFEKIIRVNTTGVLIAMKYEIQQFKKQHTENPSDKCVYSIVNCSSVVSVDTPPLIGHYNTSKAAVDALTKTAAAENGLNPTIRINAILPGPVETDLHQFTGKTAKEMLLPFTEKTLMKRNASPEEVAKPVAFLLSDEASFITGSLLPIDGGVLISFK